MAFEESNGGSDQIYSQGQKRISDKIEDISFKTSEKMPYSNYSLGIFKKKTVSHLSWPWELQLSLTTGVGWQGRWRVFLALGPRQSWLEFHSPLGNSDLILTLHLLFSAYIAYFLAACILDFQRALALFVLTGLVFLVLVHRLLKGFIGKKLTRYLKPFKNSRLNVWMKWWVR